MLRIFLAPIIILTFISFDPCVTAGEFESEALKLIQKSGQADIYAGYLDGFALSQRELGYAAIVEETQGAMSDTEIYKIVDSWVTQYRTLLDIKYTQLLIKNYRENFSLDELRELNILFDQPALQKLATNGFVLTSVTQEQLLSELKEGAFALIDGLLHENKTYRELEEQGKLSHQVDLEFNQIWDRAVDWANSLPDDGWGMFDLISYHYVADRAEDCGLKAKFEGISDIAGPMSKMIFEWRDNKLATLNGNATLKGTDSEIGDVSTSEQAMYNAAFLANSDAYWYYFLGLELGRTHEGGDACSAVKYLYDSLEGKRMLFSNEGDKQTTE